MSVEDIRGDIRVLVVDPHALTRDSLVTALNLVRFCARGCAPVVRDYEEVRKSFSPQVGILALDGSDGRQAVSTMCRCFPGIRVISLVPTENPVAVHEMVRAGAAGCISRAVAIDQVVAAVRAVLSGYAVMAPGVLQQLLEPVGRNHTRRVVSELTPRQRRIMGGISQGLTDAEIARVLGLSESTVKAEVKAILRKTGSPNRTGVVTIAFRRGLIS